MEDIVVSSGYRKTMSFLTLFSIFFQTFLPLLLNPISFSFAVDSLKTTVRYDQNTHNITIGVNTTNDLNYQLIYKTDAKIDGIVGSGTELTNIFSKDIYVGTCSDTECVPDNPLRGILKVEIPQSNWLNALYFTVIDGNLLVDQDITPLEFDLTDDENKWIETGKSSIPPPTDTVVPQVCFSPNDTIVDSPDLLWSIDVQNKTAVTTGKVKLGVRYTFPLEKKVSVTFKCLPTDESLRTPLKIEQIDISALKLPDTVNPADKFAYDITTGMTDGQFEYDLTLQKDLDSVAGVVYMEDNLSDIKTLNTSDITQQSETVKVADLDHFTIFITSVLLKISGMVNGQNQITVTPNTSIEVSVTVETSGSNHSNDWESTRYKIGSGNWTCLNTNNHSSSGTYTEKFNITSPSQIGTYNLTIRAYNDGTCSDNNHEIVNISAIVVQNATVCGNGVIEPGEECDDGNKNDSDFCNNSCVINHQKITICHAIPPDTAANGYNLLTIDDDGVFGAAHDSNHSADIIPSFDYYGGHYAGKNWEQGIAIWNNKCVVPPVCGNTIIEPPEICDSNSQTCVIPNSDYAGSQSCNQCTGWNTCEPTEFCGDGIKNGNEECDDENNQNRDGCSSSCLIEDQDNDTVFDHLDNCPNVANSDQSDINQNGIGDVCEVTEVCDNGIDDEGDGLTDCTDPDCANYPACIPTSTPTQIPTSTPTATPTPTSCVNGAGWATSVISSNQGTLKNGSPITDPLRTDPSRTLGVNNNAFYSLGYRGNLVLTFAQYVIDSDGNDLSFHEVTNGRNTYPIEKMEVFVSQDNQIWVSLGEVTNKDGVNGVGYKDISSSGFDWIKYIKLVDTTNDSRHISTADGYDLDAVDVVSGVCDQPVPTSVPTLTPTNTPTPTTVPAEIWWYKIDANLAPEDSVGGHIVTPDTWEMTVNDQVGPKNTNISSVDAYNNPGTYNHIDVSPGRYSLAEVNQDGWNLAWGRCQDSTNGVPSGWNSNIDVDQDIAGIQQVFGPDAPTSSSDYGPLGVTANNYADVNLVSGQRIYCVFYNQRFVPTPTPIPDGSLTVYKYHDLDANGTKDDNDPSLPEWDIVVDKVGGEGLTQKTDESGKTTFTLNTGDYNLYENITSGWYQSNISCSVKGSYDSSTQKYSLTVDPGADITCYIGNYQQSTITVDKNVFNYKDKDVMDNKTFTVTGDNGLGGKSFSEQSNAVFIVKPGTYSFTESTDKKYTIKSIIGDENSSIAGAQITVNSGDQKSLTFNNQKVKPKFTIHKFNNRWPFNLSPGGQIIYTLVINVLDSDIFDAVVTDLPPFGFKYQSGSYQVTVNGAPRSIPEPVYSSPGKWYVGDLSADDEVVLTYTANIDSSVDSGLYKDIAWAYGCTDSTECTPQSDDKLLAQAVDSGKIDTGVLTNSYVGSKISLDTNSADSSSKDINVVKEDSSTGQVLGATTELPSTGANGWWLLISFLLTTFGMTLIFGKKIFNLIFIIAFGLFLITPISALAVQSDTIFIRLEDPQSPTNKSQFNLDFTAIDQLNRPLTVKCFVIKPDNSTIQMGDDILVKAGGNSGQCLWGSFSQSESGQTYKYYAVASADSESYQSDQTLVIYDNSSPSTPENYAKEKINNCQYKIKFKASNDGQSNIIRVYRSDQTSFIADSGSQVGEVGISPNQEGSYTDIISSNCLKDYYYVIRAFDTSGNGSDTTGDSVVTIKSTSTSSSVVLTTIQKTAIPVTNVTLPPEPEITIVEEEPVISLEPTSAPEEGAVLGQETDNAKISTKTKTIVIITLIIVGILMVVVYRLKKRFRT